MSVAAAPSLTKLTITPSSVPVGQPTTVTISTEVITGANDPDLFPNSVNLLRLDATGKRTVLGTMRDDGAAGDSVAGDRIFSLRVTFTEAALGTITLQASAAFKGVLKRVLSANAGLTIIPQGATDSDGDGLSDEKETELGTSPRNRDTDGDGLLDGDEVNTHYTDPRKADSDGDGATDGTEVASGTNPLNQNNAPNDRDKDGLSDAQEATLGTNPNNPDSDGDGLSDGVEVTLLHTDPKKADSDGDGVDDATEHERGTNPLDATDKPDVTAPGVTITVPENLAVVNATTITVSGTVDDLTASLKVNEVPVTTNGGRFTTSVNLNEGNNTITAAATDTEGNTGTANVRVIRDTTPPIVKIETPQSNALLTGLQVDVGGMVNDIVTGATINGDDVTVTVNGVDAQVKHRSFVVPDLLLHRGPNTITVEARDRVGNVGRDTLNVVVQDQAGQRILLVAGNNQPALVGGQLADPLVVALVDANGSPVAGQPVTFSVSRGDGQLSAGGQTGTILTIDSGDTGLASVRFTLGNRAGAGNQRVLATAPGFLGQVEFCAGATSSVPARIFAVSGEMQRGVVSQPLAAPFIVLVTDTEGNPVSGAQVLFSVTRGGGNLAGASTLTRTTDTDGQAVAVLTLGPRPGLNNNVVTATVAGLSEAKATLIASGESLGQVADTTVSGIVLDNQDIPIKGATAHISGTSLSAVTTDQGQFTIRRAPVGPVHLVVDGSTSDRPGEWPELGFSLTTIAGKDNTVGMPIYLLPLDSANAKVVGGNQDVTLIMDGMEGAELTVFANSVTACPESARRGPGQCRVTWTRVNNDRIPMPPPLASNLWLDAALAPHGVHFNPPARVCFPNPGDKPGTVREVLAFDHDLGEYVSVGTATISADGRQLCTDPGFGLVASGWHGSGGPPPDTTTAAGGEGEAGEAEAGEAEAGEAEAGEAGETGEAGEAGEAEAGEAGEAEAGEAGEAEAGEAGEAEAGEAEAGEAGEAEAGEAGEAGEAEAGEAGETGEAREAGEAGDGGDGGDAGEGGEAGETNSPGTDTPDSPNNPDEGGEPLILSTGEQVITETDLHIPGRGFDFRFTRTYRSQFNYSGPLGHNWDFTYNERLFIPSPSDTNQDVRRYVGAGRIDTYKRNSDLTFTAPDGFYDELRQNPDNTFTIRDRTGFKKHFDSKGRLTSHVDRNDNTMVFTYDARGQLSKVTDTLGRAITFTFNAQGRLNSVQDFLGREVRYGYDTNGDLMSVRSPVVVGTSTGNDFPQGKTTLYEYTSGVDATANPRLALLNHNLISITDPKGQRYLVNTYGQDPNAYDFDRVIRQQHGTADQVATYTYTELNPGTGTDPNLPRNQTVEVDRNGNHIIHIHNKQANLLEERRETNRNINPDDPDVFVTTHTYNADGERLSTTMPEGNSLLYVYDTGTNRFQHGNLLSVTKLPGPRGGDQSQIKTSYHYEPIYNQLRAQTEARGNDPGFTPPNGGVNSAGRYTKIFIFDYQESNSLAALAQEMDRTEAEVSALLSGAGVSLNLGDLNGDGVTNQIAGNVVRRDDPSPRLLADSVQATVEGDTLQEITTT